MRTIPLCLFAVLACACGNAAPPPETPASTQPVASSSASAAPVPTVAPTVATTPEVEGQRVAQLWLADVDGGKYAESWTGAASLFRAAVDQPGWVKAVSSVRAPLGAMKSRTLRSAQFATKLPGAPEGQYVVIQYDTVFDKMPHAVETVTPMKDPDGQWRVSGYFVK